MADQNSRIDQINLFWRAANYLSAAQLYPRVIHELVYRRPNPDRFHVRGYIEEGTTTTPFHTVALNQMSRYHLAIEALTRLGREDDPAINDCISLCNQKLIDNTKYIIQNGIDMPEIRNWQWRQTLQPAKA